MPRRLAGLAVALLATTMQCSDATQPHAASRLVVESGDRQNGPAGEPLPQSLSVRVVDDRDQPMAGITVVFEIQNSHFSHVAEEVGYHNFA